MLGAAVLAVGLVTPGMVTWREGASVLRGAMPFQPQPLPPYKLTLLPANERRRATPLIQLALRAVEDCLGARDDAGELASVFASSGGDMGNLHILCEQLARGGKAISPTAFHNSVHNAVAGYWSIGGQARAASVSLSAHDATFVAGLLEALALVAERAAPVLYVAYDVAVAPPMSGKRPVTPDFAVALLLAPAAALLLAPAAALLLAPAAALGDPPATLRVEAVELTAAGETTLIDTPFEALRLGNPAARAVPLLRVLAAGAAGSIVLDQVGQGWRVHCAPGVPGAAAGR